MGNYLSEKTLFSKIKRRYKPRHVSVETLPTESVATSGEDRFSQSQITNWTLQIFVNRTHKVLIITKRHFRAQIAISQLFHQLSLSAARLFVSVSSPEISWCTVCQKKFVSHTRITRITNDSILWISWNISKGWSMRRVATGESRAESASKGGAMVWALASHQMNPRVDAICGLRLLLVLSLAPRGFSLGTLVFFSPQKLTLPNSNSIWNARTRLKRVLNKS